MFNKFNETETRHLEKLCPSWVADIESLNNENSAKLSKFTLCSHPKGVPATYKTYYTTDVVSYNYFTFAP